MIIMWCWISFFTPKLKLWHVSDWLDRSRYYTQARRCLSVYVYFSSCSSFNKYYQMDKKVTHNHLLYLMFFCKGWIQNYVVTYLRRNYQFDIGYLTNFTHYSIHHTSCRNFPNGCLVGLRMEIWMIWCVWFKKSIDK